MSNIAVKKRLNTTTELGSITPSLGELWVDVTKKAVVIGDGTTAGGVPMAKEVHSHANATTLTAGFMSGTDKTKLDALSLAGGIQNVLTDTTPVAPETTANFSTDFTVTDNAGASRTEFSISQTFRNEVNSNSIALIIDLS